MTASQPSPEASTERRAATATLEAGPAGGACVVKIGGDWRLSGPVLAWDSVLGERIPRNELSPSVPMDHPSEGRAELPLRPNIGAAQQHRPTVLGESRATSVRVAQEGLGAWDTSLVLFLVHGRAWCAERKMGFEIGALPANLQTLLQQVAAEGAVQPARPARPGSNWALAGKAALNLVRAGKENVSFVGECTLGFLGAARQPRRFRWMDCFFEMQQCWALSLPIVSLVSFLVGVILAFQAAIQLQQFGASILVVDLVGLAVVREMGPMMAAVVLAGRTGAAFAAQLGNMKVSEEIDALQTLGISPVDFLALPRLLAVGVMMPVIAVYANVLGVLGGLFVAATMLDIPASAYWIETQARVGLLDVSSGLIKSVFFGVAVGLAGCLRGLQCERSAAGVGSATSSAVVTGILLIILADALFAVVFNVLGI